MLHVLVQNWMYDRQNLLRYDNSIKLLDNTVHLESENEGYSITHNSAGFDVLQFTVKRCPSAT